MKYPQDLRDFEKKIANWLLDKKPTCRESVELYRIFGDIFRRYLKIRSIEEVSDHDVRASIESYDQFCQQRETLEAIEKSTLEAESNDPEAYGPGPSVD